MNLQATLLRNMTTPPEIFRPTHKLAINTLIELYPRINGSQPNSSNYVHPISVPPSGYLATVLADLMHALTTVASMCAQNDFDVTNEPGPDDPDRDLKRRMRSQMVHIERFADELELLVSEAFGAPETKSDEELTNIRTELGNQCGLGGRTCTAEIWYWIQLMTFNGYGQLLERQLDIEDML